MYIAELTVPGSRIESQDQEWGQTVQTLISHIQSSFFEANASLNLFEQETSNRQAQNVNSMRNMGVIDFDRIRQIENDILKERGLDDNAYFNENYHTDNSLMFDINLEAQIRLKREKWNSGVYPLQLKHPIIFIYAKSYLFSFDAIDRFIEVLEKTDGLPDAVRSSLAESRALFISKFPELRHVRNTTHHLEQRALRLDRFNKPLRIKGIDKPGLKTNDTTLVLNNLRGTRFGCTLNNGNYGEVDISRESLEDMRLIVQNVINSFPWAGLSQHLPYM
ncbi:hypothetical protein [Cronobacter condimenti]|uniref:hypothetical protein n=1 Tax=Cronobacter condimenti TaxID=1163710 RepID=UPI00100F468F|nr:hypothetical protein [Cronobacter condimenti]